MCSMTKQLLLQPLGGGMFGREVGRTVKQEARRSGGGYVPLVVQTTVSFLRQKGNFVTGTCCVVCRW